MEVETHNPRAKYRKARRRRCGIDRPLSAGTVPRGFGRRDAVAQQRYRDTVELINAAGAIHAKHPTWPLAAVAKSLRARRGAWAKTRGLRITVSALRRYVRRCSPDSRWFDGNPDLRGRPRGRLSLPQRRALQPFFRLLRDPETPSVKAAWELAEKEAKAAGLPFVALKTAQSIAAELSPGVVRVGTYRRRAILRWRREHGQGGGK